MSSDLSEIQAKEMEMWNRWKRGDKSALPELVTSMKPIISQWTNRISSAPLPRPYLEARVKKHLVDSLGSFDPGKGTRLSTWVNSRMKKVYRDVYPYQNIGSIPEHRVIKIHTFQAAQDAIRDKFNREPSNIEMADELGWSASEIERMNRELRKETIGTERSVEFVELEDSLTADSLEFAYRSLSPEERPVFEHLFGWGGKKMMDAREIMKKFKMSPFKYRKTKDSIIDKIESVMG